MADALDASCADLIGSAASTRCRLAPNGTRSRRRRSRRPTARRCTTSTAATEMRTEPVTQCDFQPMLDQDAPAHLRARAPRRTSCGATTSRTASPSGRRAEVVFAGGHRRAVESATTAPAGTGARTPARWPSVPLPDEGSCTNGAGDFSSRDSITSPVDRSCPTACDRPSSTFDHYVATEIGFDGGNVKISVNGGAFTVIPPRRTSTTRRRTAHRRGHGNTNPLAGQPGFTGHRRWRGRRRVGHVAGRPRRGRRRAGRHHPAALRHRARRLWWHRRLVRRQRRGSSTAS